MARFLIRKGVEEFKKLLTVSIVIYLIICSFGLLMLFLPELSNRVIGRCIGIIFILSSINSMYKFLKRSGAKLYSYNLVFSSLSFILGVIVFLFPNLFNNFITVCLGLYLIIIGSNMFTYGVLFRVGNHKSWLITIVTSILLVVIGILTIVNPFAKLTITKLCGAFIFLSSVLELQNMVMIRNNAENMVSIFW